MTLLQVLVVLAVVAAVAVVAAGLVSGRVESDALVLPEPATSLPELRLPDGPLEAADVDNVRFSLGLRGYRMDEVDVVLDRLRDQVAGQARQIEELRAEFGRSGQAAESLQARSEQAGPEQAGLGLSDGPAGPDDGLDRDDESAPPESS